MSLPTDVQRDVQPTRTLVDDPTDERAGTITIDTKNRYLYLSMEGGKAMRYDGRRWPRRLCAGMAAPTSGGAPNGRHGPRLPLCGCAGRNCHE